MKIIIKRGTLKDLGIIQELDQKLCKKENKEYDQTIVKNYPHTKIGKEYFQDRIKTGFSAIAIFNGKVVGYIVGGLDSTQPWRKITKIGSLDNMFVLEQYRSLNVGSKLASEFFRWCKKKKINRVRVAVSHQNFKAVNFYKKNGFFDYDMILEKKI